MVEMVRNIALEVLQKKKKEVSLRLNTMNEKRGEFERLTSEIEILKESENVKKFIELSKALESFKSYYYEIVDSELYNTTVKRLQDDVYLLKLLFDESYDRESSLGKCTHPIWIYTGSFGNKFEHITPVSEFNRLDNENYDNFVCNTYICMECGIQIRINKDKWKQFEEACIIFKRYPPYNSEELIYEYFNTLLENNAEETQNIMIKKYK